MTEEPVGFQKWLKQWFAILSCLGIGLLLLSVWQDPFQFTIGVFFLAVFVAIVLTAMMGTSRIQEWDKVARKYSLEREARFVMSLGRIEGTLKGRSVSLDRAKPVGDGRLIRVSSRLRLELASSLTDLEMRPERGLGRIDAAVCGELEVEHPELCQEYLFRGMDPSRLRELLSAPGVTSEMLEMQRQGLGLSISEGWLELRCPGLSLVNLDARLDRLQCLADLLELWDGAGWSDASLQRGLEWNQGSELWTLGDSSDLQQQSLCYYPPPPGRTTIYVPVAWGNDWMIRARAVGETGGIPTRDPVLDGQLILDGIPDGILARWRSDPSVIGSLLAVFCGHGAILRDGALRVERSGLISRPLEILEELDQVVDLLRP